MKSFLAVYRGDPMKGNDEWNKLSEADSKARIAQGMQAWGAWMEKYASQVVVPGGPLGKTLNVDKGGISSKVNGDCGYVIIKANSHEEAAAMFLNHPHFAIFPGENVEIMECLPIPG
jgi:hypothetical protein